MEALILTDKAIKLTDKQAVNMLTGMPEQHDRQPKNTHIKRRRTSSDCKKHAQRQAQAS